MPSAAARRPLLNPLLYWTPRCVGEFAQLWIEGRKQRCMVVVGLWGTSLGRRLLFPLRCAAAVDCTFSPTVVSLLFVALISNPQQAAWRSMKQSRQPWARFRPQHG